MSRRRVCLTRNFDLSVSLTICHHLHLDLPYECIMYYCLVILLIQQQIACSCQAATVSQEETSKHQAPSGSHPDIVVLKWPPPKTYYPAHDLPDTVTASSSVDDDEDVTDIGTDQLQDRQDYGHTVNLIVPQSPDPVLQHEAPLPPHPYYRDLPPPHQDDEKTPESEWEKVREKLRLKPVNHQMFKTNGKHVATLPYAPTQPFYEIQYGIDQIRRAVHKMHPMAGLANDVFKKFNMAVKVSVGRCGLLCWI